MFPDSDHYPAGPCESIIGSTVSSDIRVELLPPPRRVGLREGLVVGTAVPETTIDKHGNSNPGEHDVGSGSPDLGKRQIYAVPESPAVKFAADRQLRAGVTATNPAHPSRVGWRRANRFRHEADGTGSVISERYPRSRGH